MIDRWLLFGKVAIFTLLARAVFTVLANTFQPTEENPLEVNSKKVDFDLRSWEEIMDQAKQEEKLIFVDLYASWCGPCKMMKLHTFNNREVASFYNNNFINVALNGELGKGLELMEEYQLRAFPSLLFIDKDNNLIAHTNGYHNPKQFLEVGKTVSRIK